MVEMARSSGLKSLLIRGMVLGLLLEAGCARPLGVPTDGGAAQTAQTPFHDDGAPVDPVDVPSSYANLSERELPFHNSRSLPAGTLLMVRLINPLSAEKPDADVSFEATVDTPVLAGGNMLIPRGTIVTGRVESTHASRLRPGGGYVQLALQSVHVGGADLPIQTASLFVRQSSKAASPGSIVSLEKGRRLTFRLIQPVYASNQTVQVAR